MTPAEVLADAARVAIERLEVAARVIGGEWGEGAGNEEQDAADALRTALSAFDAARGEEPKPVAWALTNPKMGQAITYSSEVAARDAATMDGDRIVPLYAAPHPTPPPGEVEAAREKCVLVCRRAAEEYERNGGCLYNDRHQTICANAVTVGRALLAAEAAAKKETR